MCQQRAYLFDVQRTFTNKKDQLGKRKKTTVNEQKIKSLYPGHDREMQFKPHTNFDPSVNEGQNRSYFSEM